MMKIVLLGMNGQVGWELQRSLVPLGELVALDRQSQTLCGDLADLDGIVRTVQTVQPDVIVNAGAHTAVDKAETDFESASLVNAEAPAVLAKAAKACGAMLVHYSTDYVFDGSGDQAWTETDPVKPLNVYGKTKLAGEIAIQEAGCAYLIFRTSWVYAARGNNFAKTMLRLAQDRNQLSVINDQVGAPTGAELIADATAHAIRAAESRPELSGLYHLAAAGQTTWFGYASHVLRFSRQLPGVDLQLKVSEDMLQAIPSSQYPTPAQRPLNSRLNTDKFQDQFGLHLPAWQVGVERMLVEYLKP